MQQRTRGVDYSLARHEAHSPWGPPHDARRKHGGAVLVRAAVEEIITLPGVVPAAVAGVRVKGQTIVAPVVIAQFCVSSDI